MRSFKMVSKKFEPVVGKTSPLAIQTAGTSDIFSRNAISIHSQVIVEHDETDFHNLNRTFSGNCGWDGNRVLFVHNTDARYVEPVEIFFESNNVGKLQYLFLHDPFFIAVLEDSSIVFGGYGTEEFIIEPQVQAIVGLGDFETLMPVLNKRRGLILANGRVWTPGRMRSQRDRYMDISDEESIYVDKRKEIIDAISRMSIKLWSREKTDKELTELFVEMDDATKEWADKNIAYWDINDPVRLGTPFANWMYPCVSGFEEKDIPVLEMVRNVEHRSSLSLTIEDGYVVLDLKQDYNVRDSRLDKTIGFNVCPGLEYPAANSFFSRDYNNRGRQFFEY